MHAGHHGADNSSETDFLNSIEAEVAIISAGDDNPHGHPVLEALQRLHDSGIDWIYQTNQGATAGVIPEEIKAKQVISQGEIVITSDGFSYSVTVDRMFPAN